MRRFLVFFLPSLGVLLLLSSFVMAVRAGGFSPSTITLAASGMALFLSLFVRTELPNLRHAALVTLYSGCVLGSVVVVYLFALRHDLRFDLTRQRIHTLTEPTRQYLRMLDKPVEIIVFDTEERPYRDLLDQYAASGRVSWVLRDPRRDPAYTRLFDTEVVDQTLYVRQGDKKKRLTREELAENNLTNAIIEVSRQTEVKVCFLTGHGEIRSNAPAGRDPGSARVFSDLIAGRAISVSTLNLMDEGYIPQDATLIVIPGPASDLHPAEARQLGEFLDRGGRLLVYFDLPAQTGAVADQPNLAALLRSRGIEPTDNVVVDMRGGRLLGSPLKAPAAWMNEAHPITAPLARSGGAPMGLTLVRALALPEDVKGFKSTPLLGSSDEAWAEPFANIGRKVNAPDRLSRQIMGAAAEGPALQADRPPARLVVFGSSELVRDSFLPTSNPAALLALGAVGWLTEQNDSIPIPDRVIQGTPLIIGEARTRLVLVFIVILFPSILFFGGITFTRLRGHS